MNITLVYSTILDMTLLCLLIFSIIMFLVYFDYMLSIVGLDLYSNIGSYSARSLISWVSGQYCVGVVPIPYFPAIAPYISDRVVVRRCDIPVEFYIVHLPNVDHVEHNYTTIIRKGWLCS
jgi:predicted AlkP superfamily pyrophosphatase or phosphodiesterase